jgi:Tfp pilus assembly PilM family ATPase
MSPLPAWLHSPPPSLAIDIDARRIVAVLARNVAGTPTVEAHAVVALPAGAVVPSLTTTNVLQPQAVVAAISRATELVGGRHKRCALVVPDTVAKVTLLRFEQVPAQPRDLEQLVRLQLRKALPFPVDQAQIAIVDGHGDGTGREMVAVAARRDIVGEYEGACAAAGLHAGTVDIATLNIVNTVLLGDAARGAAGGDWLLVHAGTEYSSLAIVRDGAVIFFRTRAADAEEHLADVVHQTRMYFEDRLGGTGFARVLLAGADSSETRLLARELEARLGVAVEAVDIRRAAAIGDRVPAPAADVMASLAAPAGLVLREG